MSGSAAKVVITERQQDVLRKLSTATTVAKRLVQRATIILLAFAGLSNEDIAGQVGLERHQIGIWRRRWQRAFNKLVRIECTEDSPATLRHAIEEVLTDEPRPGSPGKFTAEQITPGAPWRIRIDQALRDRIRPEVPDGWLGLDEAATALGVARQTVLHKVQRGELQAVHVNRGRRKGLRIQVKPDQHGLFDTP